MVVGRKRDPLVPDTVTATVPETGKLQESVEFPPAGTLVGKRMQEVLLLVRVTTPSKPLMDNIVSVDDPLDPARIVTLDGLAMMP